MKNNRGQGIIEIIFSIGIIAVVITGVVSLIVNVLKLKTNSLMREKAVRMSDVVLEKLVNSKTMDEKGTSVEHTFWNVDVPNGVNNGVIISGTLPDFENYTYSVGFTRVVNAQKCRDDTITCVNASINIFWGEDNSYSTTRFFYKSK